LLYNFKKIINYRKSLIFSIFGFKWPDFGTANLRKNPELQRIFQKFSIFFDTINEKSN